MMNYWLADKGTKVRYVYPDKATGALKDAARQRLVLGQTYTVDRLSIGSQMALVKLDGIEGFWNCAMFEDARLG